MKEWRKVLVTGHGRIFINLRKSELLMLGFKKPDKLEYTSRVEDGKLILEFRKRKK